MKEKRVGLGSSFFFLQKQNMPRPSDVVQKKILVVFFPFLSSVDAPSLY